MELVQKILAFVSFARSIDLSNIKWDDMKRGVGMLLEIIDIIRQGFGPQPMFSATEKIGMKAAFVTAEAKSLEALTDDLEAAVSQPQGPVIDIVLPILVALLKKWLGF